jgi:F0F1-type ATP synthase epsilon subunit
MFKLTLICNEEKVCEAKVCGLRIKTNGESVAILPGHQPYMAKIEESISYTIEDGAEQTIEISSGFVYTNGLHSFVVADR